jgi:DNA topoisomerase-2
VVVAAASPPLPLNPSFVNSLSTPRGGAHLSHALSLLSAALLPLARRRLRSLSDLTPRQVRDALTVFVSCRLESPDFDTQSKEFLTSPPEAWGSAWELPHDFKEQLAGTSVLGDLVGKLSARRSESLGSGIKRGKGNKLSIAKLDDANRAGPGTGGGCTLVLTEGDSAKALAVSGLSVLGRDEFGVFPLRGKVLNVRDVSAKALGKNKEVENIVRILGLDFKKRCVGGRRGGGGGT